MIVVAAMPKTANPDAWIDTGGLASIAAVLDEIIVVSATETLHEQIQDFMDKIDFAFDQSSSPTAI